MSSSSVSQLLQITAPRAAAKPQQTNSSPDGQFQELLARASSTVEDQPNQRTETSPIRPSDEKLTDHSEQDASFQHDEAVATSDAPSGEAADAPEIQEDDQSDAIELSEAAELLLATQVVPEEILSVEITTELAIETPVIDTSSIDVPPVENLANQSEPESQPSTEQFVKTIEVNLLANQYGQFTEEEAATTEQAVVAEPSELPANELTDDSDGEPAGESFSEQAGIDADRPTEQPAQTIAGKEQAKPASTRDVERPESAAGAPPANIESSVALKTETSEERETPARKSKVARGRESVSVETDATAERLEIVGAEEKVSVAKEVSPVHSSSSTPVVVNSSSGEATAASLRSSTGSTGEESNVNTDLNPVPTVDRARFVQRVGRAFQSAQAGKGEIQLRLSPPELGSMRISITVHEGVVSAKVEVETAAARNVMLDNLPALRERLAEQEIRIEKFDVDVGREGGQETDNSGPDDREARQARANSVSSSRERELENSKTTPSPRHVNSIDSVANGGLDVRV